MTLRPAKHSARIRKIPHVVMLMRKHLLILVFVLSACGSDDKPTTTNNTNTNNTNTNNIAQDMSSDQDVSIEPDADAGLDATEDMDVDMPEPTPPGTCQTAADCGGDPCLPVVAGGWMTCQATISEPPTCDSPNDECCLNAECTDNPGGACIAGPIFYCGGARPMEMNSCFYPECQTEADCNFGMHSICLQAGLFNEPVNRCIYGGCKTNADCTEGTNGLCRPFIDPCSRRLTTMHCVYDESECREDSECTATQGIPVCAIENGVPTCTEFLPPP